MTESSQKREENTLGKGEIASYKQFPFSTVLLKDLYCRHVKPGLVWEKVKKKKHSF